MDGHEWKNVQAPVRDMLLALTRAIKDQSNDMTRILHRMDSFVTKEASIKELFTREEGLRLETGKATIEVVRVLEGRLDESNKQIAKLGQIVEYQTTAITDLNCRLERAQRQLAIQDEHILRPNYDDIYAYIDKTDRDIRRDTQLALHSKEDKVENVDETLNDRNMHIPENIAIVLRKVQEEINVLDSHVKRVAASESASIEAVHSLKEEITVLHDAQRAEVQDVKVQTEARINQVVSGVKDYTRDLLASEMGERGVVGRLASLEKSLSGLDAQCSSAYNEIERGVDSKIRKYHDEKLSRFYASQLDAAAVQAILDKTLQSKRIGDVTGTELHRALIDHSAAMRMEAAKDHQLLKRELNLMQSEGLREWQSKILDRVEGISAQTESARKEAEAERSRLRDLSEEIKLSLSKKANQSEIRAIVRGGKLSGSQNSSPDTSPTASAEALIGLQEKVQELQSELNQVRRSTGVEISSVRSTLQEKLGSAQVEELVSRAMQKRGGYAMGSSAGGSLSDDADEQHYNRQGTFKQMPPPDIDWKLAVGDLGLVMRRELADKLSRDECRAVLNEQMHDLTAAVERMSQEMDNKVEQHEYARMVQSLDTLNSRVVGELTGGLWLWTSRQLVRGDPSASDTRIPWDTQVVNAVPSSLLWRKGFTEITVKLPGLYRLGLAVFTSMPVTLTVCLNGEPVLSLGPDSAPDRLSSFANSQGLREERYLLRRLRHSAGDTTAVSIDEPLSLPVNAVISVVYQSSVASQAYLSLRKL